MEGGRRYVEVDDQPAFAARMDLELALHRCASFQQFELAVRSLL
jgi:hypothetical protein